jgi:hypothetical protein
VTGVVVSLMPGDRPLSAASTSWGTPKATCCSMVRYESIANRLASCRRAAMSGSRAPAMLAIGRSGVANSPRGAVRPHHHAVRARELDQRLAVHALDVSHERLPALARKGRGVGPAILLDVRVRIGHVDRAQRVARDAA